MSNENRCTLHGTLHPGICGYALKTEDGEMWQLDMQLRPVLNHVGKRAHVQGFRTDSFKSFVVDSLILLDD